MPRRGRSRPPRRLRRRGGGCAERICRSGGPRHPLRERARRRLRDLPHGRRGRQRPAADEKRVRGGERGRRRLPLVVAIRPPHRLHEHPRPRRRRVRQRGALCDGGGRLRADAPERERDGPRLAELVAGRQVAARRPQGGGAADDRGRSASVRAGRRASGRLRDRASLRAGGEWPSMPFGIDRRRAGQDRRTFPSAERPRGARSTPARPRRRR